MTSKKYGLYVLNILQFAPPIFMAILFFVLPLMAPRAYFRQSSYWDLAIRIFLWLYASYSYWSLTNILVKQIKKISPQNPEMSKNVISFSLYFMSGLIFGISHWFLIFWPLSVFTPWLPKVLIELLSLGNAVLYGGLVLSQYLLLPESD